MSRPQATVRRVGREADSKIRIPKFLISSFLIPNFSPPPCLNGDESPALLRYPKRLPEPLSRLIEVRLRHLDRVFELRSDAIERIRHSLPVPPFQLHVPGDEENRTGAIGTPLFKDM